MIGLLLLIKVILKNLRVGLIVTYRFRVVLFSAVCSPFMLQLNTTLHCHLVQYNSPTAENMLTNLYIDNVDVHQNQKLSVITTRLDL